MHTSPIRDKSVSFTIWDMTDCMDHLIWAECLLEMCVLEEPGDWQHVWPGVHQNEEEYSGQVEPRHWRVVFHHEVKKRRYFLHQNWVEGHQQLQHMIQIWTYKPHYMQPLLTGLVLLLKPAFETVGHITTLSSSPEVFGLCPKTHLFNVTEDSLLHCFLAWHTTCVRCLCSNACHFRQF